MITFRAGKTALGAALLVLAACSAEQQDWRSAEAAGTSEAYQRFLDQHPDSELGADGRQYPAPRERCACGGSGSACSHGASRGAPDLGRRCGGGQPLRGAARGVRHGGGRRSGMAAAAVALRPAARRSFTRGGPGRHLHGAALSPAGSRLRRSPGACDLRFAQGPIPALCAGGAALTPSLAPYRSKVTNRVTPRASGPSM